MAVTTRTAVQHQVAQVTKVKAAQEARAAVVPNVDAKAEAKPMVEEKAAVSAEAKPVVSGVEKTLPPAEEKAAAGVIDASILSAVAQLVGEAKKTTTTTEDKKTVEVNVNINVSQALGASKAAQQAEVAKEAVKPAQPVKLAAQAKQQEPQATKKAEVRASSGVGSFLLFTVLTVAAAFVAVKLRKPGYLPVEVEVLSPPPPLPLNFLPPPPPNRLPPPTPFFIAFFFSRIALCILRFFFYVSIPLPLSVFFCITTGAAGVHGPARRRGGACPLPFPLRNARCKWRQEGRPPSEPAFGCIHLTLTLKLP